MGIQLSPSVVVKETDLTNIVPGVATSIGAAVIEAGWGPVQEVTTVNSENTLAAQFGKPTDSNAANWLSAANFLAYSNNLLVVRSDTTNQRNAVSALTYTVSSIPVVSGGTNYKSVNVSVSAPPAVVGGVAPIQVLSGGSGYGTPPAVTIAAAPGGGVNATATAVLGSGATAGMVVSITMTAIGSGYLVPPAVSLTGGGGTGAQLSPTVLTGTGLVAQASVVISNGVITSVEITDPGYGYYTVPTVTLTDAVAISGQVITPGSLGTPTIVAAGLKINNLNHYTASFENGEATVGEFAAKYPGSIGNSLTVSMADSASFESWEYKSLFNGAPSSSTYATARAGAFTSGDELHIVIVDKEGKWSGTAGTVLEKFEYVSKAGDAKKEDGSSAYYRSVLKEQSAYVWNMDHPSVGTNWGQPAGQFAFASIGATAITRSLSGGVDHYTATDGQRMNAFSLYQNDEALDVNLIITGKASSAVANYVIQNVAEFRKDCMAFVSPQDVSSGNILIGNTSAIVDKIIAYRNTLPSSSYFVIDSGYKYQYDRYSDKYRWVPLNGDIAGLCARTDETNDPWFSPAGLTRGSIKNVVKLAFSPTRTDRDNLYKVGVNPVVSFPGQGVVLYGDKTGLSKPSAFDRINVRRLFIVLEKAIATAAKYQLFEINDVQTRAQFRATVEPFLRDVKGRRGLYDFRVVCDETNNTPQVIDSNRFAGTIFLSPARSINFIELNFVATRTGVDFTEIAGAV
jgi:hypothetical protein